MTIRTVAVVLCASGRSSARVGADPGDMVLGDGGEWSIPFGDWIGEAGGLGRLPRGSGVVAGRGGHHVLWTGQAGRVPSVPVDGS
jgi:hypothetical protein